MNKERSSTATATTIATAPTQQQHQTRCPLRSNNSWKHGYSTTKSKNYTCSILSVTSSALLVRICVVSVLVMVGVITPSLTTTTITTSWWNHPIPTCLVVVQAKSSLPKAQRRVTTTTPMVPSTTKTRSFHGLAPHKTRNARKAQALQKSHPVPHEEELMSGPTAIANVLADLCPHGMLPIGTYIFI